MSDKINIREVRVIAEAVKRVYHDDDILALIEAVEAAHAVELIAKPCHHYYDLNSHFEETEVSCSCGYVATSDNFDEAEAQLADHIHQAAQEALRKNQEIVNRRDEAFARFDFGDDSV